MKEYKNKWEISPEAISPLSEMRLCPVLDFLHFLNRKYSLIVLINIAFVNVTSFSDLLMRNPQISPRVLSMRIREYLEAGIISKSLDISDGRKGHYTLTERGRDVIPILTSVIQYGIRNLAADVFSDQRPRELGELFPNMQERFLGKLLDYAKSF